MVLKNLNSVGHVIDENGVVYPMLADGGHDIFAGVHINDLYFFGDGDNEEFFDALSQEDIDTIEDILGNPTDTLLEQTAEEYYAMRAELAYGI
jgi:hypothetical protein|tara:strand:- start:18 stop:296 length:279 start_codon:yes stop_codon:yes gene_type:complete